jgi:hypothetical protein
METATVTYTPISEVPCDFFPIPQNELEHYRNRMSHIWGYDNGQNEHYFPGATPVSLDRSRLEALDPDDYLASLKADGTRHILMLTTNPEGEPKAIFVDRKMSMYEVQVWAKEDFFRLGSLVDGEMVTTPNHPSTFLVFDLIVVAGQDKTGLRYEERIGGVATMFGFYDVRNDINGDDLEREVTEKNRVVAAPNAGFVMTPKPTVALSHNLWGLWERRNSVGFQSDGVVFTRRDYQATEGTAEDILKWKPINTIDVVVNSSGRMIIGVPPHTFDANETLLAFKGGSWKCILDSNVVTDSMTAQEVDVVVECRSDLDPETNTIRFTPLQVRRDKKFGNGIHTVKMTLVNVMEAIGIDEIISACTDKLKRKQSEATKRHKSHI